MTSPRATSALCRLGQIFLIPAVLVSCAALIVGMRTVRDGLQETAASLASAEPQLQDLALMTTQLTTMSSTLATGLGDSAATIETLSRLTGTVGQVVEVVAPFSGNIRQAAEDLKQSQVTFNALHASTLATQAELAKAQPDLQRAAAAAAKLPATLRDARKSLEAKDDRLQLFTMLAVLAIVLFGIVLFVMLQSVAHLTRRQS